MIRIALIDDSPAQSAALSALLADQSDVEVVAAGSLGSDIVDLLVQAPPDVVVLDPPAQPETIRRLIASIHARMPQTRLIVTSLDEDHSHIREIWAASGEEFIPKRRLFREPREALASAFGLAYWPHLN
jgi:two-component system response regulator DesR